MRLSYLSVLALTLLGLCLSACPEPPPEPVTIVRPVRYEVATSAVESATRTFAGVSSSGLESSLSFRVSGNIQSVAVTVGDTVSEGDLIAQLDTSDYDVQLRQASADVSLARAQERNAEADYERIRSLYESGSVSRSDLDFARAAADSNRAQVRAARERVRQAEDQIEYCTLTAPVDGRIAEVPVDVNENVTAGQTIAVLMSRADQELEVDVDIPEAVIARISRGMAVSVTFDVLRGRNFRATVSEVGTASGRTTFPVTVVLDELDPEIRAGMAANVTFTFGDVADMPRFWLPAYVVQEDIDGRYIYLVDRADEEGHGVIRRQAVTVGEIDNRGLEILEGLSEGDRVVTAGISRIVDGQLVRLPALLLTDEEPEDDEPDPAQQVEQPDGEAPEGE